MHRFETKNGHSQYVSLVDVMAIDPSDHGNWCSLHFKGGGRIMVDATADDVFALVKAAKEPNSVPYTPRVPIDYFTGLPAQ
jgi:hypothetical protein